MSAILTINNNKEIFNNAVKLQYIPATINGCGKANMTTHFDPYTVESGGILSNSLRGYPIKGEKMKLHSKFIGICARNEIRITDEEEIKMLKAFGFFESMIYWNYDAIPSKSDSFKQAMQMPDVLDNISDISLYDVNEEIKRVDPRYSALTNFEVLQILKNMRDTRKKPGLRNLATITYETLQFLEESSCKNQTKKGIQNFLDEIKPFKFTKNECLMVINDPPTSPLHIQLLIEDSEERLTEDQVNKVLEIVEKNLILNE